MRAARDASRGPDPIGAPGATVDSGPAAPDPRVAESIDHALGRWGGTASRRDFLKTSGLFVFGLSAAGAAGAARQAFGSQPAESGAYPDPDFLQLDSWLVVHEDGRATFYVGKTDGGQGTGTATRQMMCDELDLAFDRATVVMGRTDLTVDQGGSGGSDAIERDAMVGRRIAGGPAGAAGDGVGSACRWRNSG